MICASRCAGKPEPTPDGSGFPLRSLVVERLRSAGCVFAEDEADLLIAHARTPSELSDLLQRRVAGEPLEQVVGWADFCGRRIVVEPGVFVPRRRTEFLVAQALARLQAGAVVVDLCCGSGAVGAAIGHGVDVELYAADLDPNAVRCARRNVNGQVFEGDLYAALPATLRGRIDVLVVNAPYVPSDAVAFMPPEAREHEPLLALDGGADGLDIARRVVGRAPAWLRPGGWLLIETSPAQAPALEQLFRDAGLAPEVASSEELAATVVLGR